MLDKGDEAIIRNIVLTAFAESAKAQAITAEALAQHTEELAGRVIVEQHSDIDRRIHLHAIECPAVAAVNAATSGWRTLAAVAGLITGAVALIAVLLEIYWKIGT